MPSTPKAVIHWVLLTQEEEQDMVAKSPAFQHITRYQWFPYSEVAANTTSIQRKIQGSGACQELWWFYQRNQHDVDPTATPALKASNEWTNFNMYSTRYAYDTGNAEYSPKIEPFNTVQLLVNNKPRISTRKAQWYRLGSHRMAQHRKPDLLYYYKNFAEDPSLNRPTGSINLAMMDTVFLNLTMNNGIARSRPGTASASAVGTGDDLPGRLYVFAKYINYARFQNGAATLMYP